jgi:hypothetical protein
MRLKSIVALGFCAFLLNAPAALPAANFAAAPQTIAADMAFLASDDRQGRATGEAGYDAAAAYVAARFEDMGLSPGGDHGSFLQNVTFVRHRAVSEGAMRLIRDDATVSLDLGDEYRPSMTPHGEDILLTAPMVFVRRGIVAREYGIDDYDNVDVDVRGKIVVALEGAPPGLDPAARRLASLSARARYAAERGAVGLITVSDAAAGEHTPGDTSNWSWSWHNPDGSVALASAPVLGSVHGEGAAKLFEGAAMSFAEVVRLSGEEAGALRSFELPGLAEVSTAGELGDRAVSSNVVAIVEGSDPELKNEYVVMTAHLDHTGVREGATGDAINNGALDNAGGISIMLEAARGVAEGEAPRRSVIFVALTGEEIGLLGSGYFVANPPVPVGSIVANVNMDMPIITYDIIDVAAIGAEHSNAVEAVERAAGKMGLAVVDDPLPELGLFTRSDHYRFVQMGIPSIFLIGGFGNGGEFAFRDFYDNRYHRPDDDLDQAINYTAAAKWAELNHGIALELANQDERPSWRDDSPFKP